MNAISYPIMYVYLIRTESGQVIPSAPSIALRALSNSIRRQLDQLVKQQVISIEEASKQLDRARNFLGEVSARNYELRKAQTGKPNRDERTPTQQNKHEYYLAHKAEFQRKSRQQYLLKKALEADAPLTEEQKRLRQNQWTRESKARKAALTNPNPATKQKAPKPKKERVVLSPEEKKARHAAYAYKSWLKKRYLTSDLLPETDQSSINTSAGSSPAGLVPPN